MNADGCQKSNELLRSHFTGSQSKKSIGEADRFDHKNNKATYAMSVLAVAESYLNVGGICCLVL